MNFNIIFLHLFYLLIDILRYQSGTSTVVKTTEVANTLVFVDIIASFGKCKILNNFVIRNLTM